MTMAEIYAHCTIYTLFLARSDDESNVIELCTVWHEQKFSTETQRAHTHSMCILAILTLFDWMNPAQAGLRTKSAT